MRRADLIVGGLINQIEALEAREKNHCVESDTHFEIEGFVRGLLTKDQKARVREWLKTEIGDEAGSPRPGTRRNCLYAYLLWWEE